MATFTEIARFTEDEARDYLERIRWPDGAVCPHCGDMERSRALQGDAHRPGLYKCYSCRKQFTVTVGTIMHQSKIPLHKWIMAFYLVCASKKSISALQLQRMLDLGSYRTAWHLAHRIRFAMQAEPLRGLLSGTIEADETYVGGKPRKRAKGRPTRKKGRQADFVDRKTQVVALVQRNGEARAFVRTDVRGHNLRDVLTENVDPTATLMTDEYVGYQRVGPRFAAHHTVKHSEREYARGDAHINSAESFFSLLKRGIVGAFHNVSRKHLHRYTSEFEFRWNHRHTNDATRTEAAIRAADGKRLTYRPIVG